MLSDLIHRLVLCITQSFLDKTNCGYYMIPCAATTERMGEISSAFSYISNVESSEDNSAFSYNCWQYLTDCKVLFKERERNDVLCISSLSA